MTSRWPKLKRHASLSKAGSGLRSLLPERHRSIFRYCQFIHSKGLTSFTLQSLDLSDRVVRMVKPKSSG